MQSSGLFPNSDFSWSMRMRREPVEAFFGIQDKSGKLLEEKRNWILNRPDLCIATTESGDHLVSECLDLAAKWRTVDRSPDQGSDYITLGNHWEADFILMDGESTELAGGCVCFPSSWSLQESIGVSLHEVHERVPGLNAAIGDKIKKFLDRMSPGDAYFRENWGLTRTSELNYHPDLNRAPLDETIDEKSVYFRIEHQSFVKLPSGILLGVRIEPVGFPELAERYPETANQLLRQLETMPAEVAEYKSLSSGIETATDILRNLIATSRN